MARGTPLTATAIEAPVRMWPITRPIGRAMAAAMTSAMTEYWMCCQSRVGMPLGPDQLALSVNQSQVSRDGVHRAARLRAHGVRTRPTSDDHEVEHDGEHDRGDDAGPDLAAGGRAGSRGRT